MIRPVASSALPTRSTVKGIDYPRGLLVRSLRTTLPEQLRRSLTWNQGAEMAQHAQLRIDTGLAVYFCDPQRPWQRGTNENTNGPLRQYFQKGTDLTKHTRDDLNAVAIRGSLWARGTVIGVRGV